MILTKGHKCYFLGENICGDGIHSREELANKIKSQKVVNVSNPDVLAKGFKEHHNGENIIGDTEGKHLNYLDLNWPTFLAKQMANPIRFKYTQSAFPPGPDTIRELTLIAATTLNSYDFKAYEAVRLNDMAKESQLSISKEEIQSLREETDKGRIHTIEFNY